MPLTLLLPIRIDPHSNFSDLDRFELFGLPSLKKFIPRSLVHELLVITPQEDLGTIRKRLHPICQFPLRIITDSSICSDINEEKGWYKQQIIKLAAAQLISTKWYLTLDSDVICTRPVDEGFFFDGERAIWQQEPVSKFPQWFKGSQDVLKTASAPDHDQMVMGVTPALMHTASTLSLIAKIGARHIPSAWTEVLVKSKEKQWTEYSLYWLHLIEDEAINKLYVVLDRHLYTNESIWHSHQASSLNENAVSRIFSHHGNHAFFVFQSRSGIPLQDIAEKIRPRLGLPGKLPFSTRFRIFAHTTRVRLRRLQGLLKRRT